jgi:hypothetical protein
MTRGGEGPSREPLGVNEWPAAAGRCYKSEGTIFRLLPGILRYRAREKGKGRSLTPVRQNQATGFGMTHGEGRMWSGDTR